MAGEIKMGYNKITQLEDPTEDSGPVTRRWVRTFGGNLANVNGFTMKGNINMDDGGRLTSTGVPTADTDSVNKKWVDDEITKLATTSPSTGGFTMTGGIDMGGWTIEKLSVSSPKSPDNQSVPNVKWVDDRFMRKTGGLVEGDIDMGDSSDIINLRDPTNNKDAVNK
jgi:hypothetical protein